MPLAAHTMFFPRRICTHSRPEIWDHFRRAWCGFNLVYVKYLMHYLRYIRTCQPNTMSLTTW
jgi:hypothetical protein